MNYTVPLQDIKKVCNKSGAIVIATKADGAQWLGDGYALYSIGEKIGMTEENAKQILGIQKGYIRIKNIEWESHDGIFHDTTEALEEAELVEGLTVNCNGLDCAYVIKNDGTTIIVNNKFLMPLKKVDGKKEYYVKGDAVYVTADGVMICIVARMSMRENAQQRLKLQTVMDGLSA